MIKQLILSIIFLSFTNSVLATASMFNDNGDFQGSWKQMTNINNTQQKKHNSSSYSTYNWSKNVTTNAKNNASSFANQSEVDVMPFRYNTLDYKKVRKVKGGYGDYSTRCTDIGDASFCQ